MSVCHQGAGQRAVMLCDRKGNRRSGVALAMRHRLKWFVHLRADGHGKGDEHPTYAPFWGMVHFTAVWYKFLCCCWTTSFNRPTNVVRKMVREECTVVVDLTSIILSGCLGGCIGLTSIILTPMAMTWVLNSCFIQALLLTF